MKLSRTTIVELAIPAAVIAILTVLTLVGVSRGLEHKVYDALLHFAPPIRQDPNLVVIDIDDQAIAAVGTFPWPRDTYTRAMTQLKELGATYLTFDIEFINQSPSGVNAKALESDMPTVINAEFNDVIDNAVGLVKSMAEGNLSAADAREYVDGLKSSANDGRDHIIQKVTGLLRSNDDYLAQGLRLFGNAFLTYNVLIPNEDSERGKAAQAYAKANRLAKTVRDERANQPVKDRFTPPLQKLLEASQGAGFTNVDPDEDGVTRRIHLVHKIDGGYITQLILTPLLHRMGNPPVVLRPGELRIERSKLNPADTDLSIPLDADETMLVNYTKGDYRTAFKHQSFGQLVYLENLESQIVSLVRDLEGDDQRTKYARNVDFPRWFDKANSLLDSALATGSQEVFQNYVKLRRDFFAAATEFAAGPTKEKILADLAKLRPRGSNTETVDEFNVRKRMDELQALCTLYNKEFAEVGQRLANAFCVIGQTATGTTDIGVTPFESEFMNVDLHANVANTIIQGNFIREWPTWAGLLIAAGLCAGLLLVARRLQPLAAALASFGVLIAFLIVASLLFIVTSTYVGVAIPGIAVLASAIGLTLLKFSTAEQEKGVIRDAFSRYLSGDVIKQILDDPSALKLGGDEKAMTAIFTDVKGFSTISEKLTAPELVRLLNLYLTRMSDIILDSQGCIDKYEGDAIIAFWGAPIPLADHARRACLSAIAMRRAEIELNEQFKADKLSPTPLYTRIGINSGNMVVGNMGTPTKMNYTIMGNAVNLAARLEGVNKQYGTWILVSESTRSGAGEGILFRSLDRVRVVGIDTPVRLYEVVEEESVATANQKEAVFLFEEGIQLFETRKWKQAAKNFTQIRNLIPDDGPATTFLGRCQQYQKEPPADNWDGVFNLTTK